LLVGNWKESLPTMSIKGREITPRQRLYTLQSEAHSRLGLIQALILQVRINATDLGSAQFRAFARLSSMPKSR